MTGCVFCAIGRGEAPVTMLAENPDTMIFVPLSPVTPGHVLVVPRRHVADAATEPLTTAIAMHDAARYASDHLTQFNIITSAGPAATQTIFHLHLHLVPRTPDDGLALPWTAPAPPAPSPVPRAPDQAR